MALTDKTHELIRAHFKSASIPLNIAVDATCGNGHDTLFLAKFEFKNIIGFDIQEAAINATKQRIKVAQIKTVKLIQSGHEDISKHIKTPVDCFMFNLGYLPSADKNITTKKITTLSALNACLNLLSEDGLISVLCYPGHPAGLIETESVQEFLNSLSVKWKVSRYDSESPSNTAPILFIITQSNKL